MPVSKTLADAIQKWQQDAGKKPQPPQGTGPAVGPPGVLRAQTAAQYGMGDRARSEFGKVPVSIVKTSDWGGAYYPNQDRIELNQGNPLDAQPGILAHEFAHRQWQQNPSVSDDESGYVRDVMKLANDPRFPEMRNAVSDWVNDAQGELYNYQYIPTELDARVVQHGGKGEGVPQWFRTKWGQDTFGGLPRGEGPMPQPKPGFQTPFGFVDKYTPPPVAQGPWADTGWRRDGRFVWDTLMDSGFDLDR